MAGGKETVDYIKFQMATAVVIEEAVPVLKQLHEVFPGYCNQGLVYAMMIFVAEQVALNPAIEDDKNREAHLEMLINMLRVSYERYREMVK